MPRQRDWRFCAKCNVMFFDGDPNRKGVCRAGGGHAAMGFNFTLPFDEPETGTAQRNWRFCTKCMAMFWDGVADRKGLCPAGAGHLAQGFMFALPHDLPASHDTQAQWRFCQNCMAMFWDGAPGKGACPTGGGHVAQGFMFVLPFDDQVQAFDTGPIVSDLPLGGSAHLVMARNGDFTFSSHVHDSGFDNIHYVLEVVLMTPSGLAFTFTHVGHVEGTVAGLPFGTPDRNDDFIQSGNNPSITNEFDRITNSLFIGKLTGVDKLVAGVEGFLSDVVDEAAKDLGKAAAAGIVALIA
jgi:hypothetical protein